MIHIMKRIMRSGGEFDSPSNALMFGGGTSDNPATTSNADAKFVEFRCQTTADSGDNRLVYLRYALEGDGGGECLRAFTNVNENVGTAHGAHISLSFEATAGGSECSGLGAALRATTHIPNVASWAPTGTLTGLQVDIHSDGSASDPAGLTELSFIRISNSGDTTGAADVDDDAFLFSLQGFTLGAGHTIGANTAAGTTLDFTNWVPIKIKIGSTTHYLVAAQTIAATGG